jgi:hypothetical protein
VHKYILIHINQRQTRSLASHIKTACGQPNWVEECEWQTGESILDTVLTALSLGIQASLSVETMDRIGLPEQGSMMGLIRQPPASWDTIPVSTL